MLITRELSLGLAQHDVKIVYQTFKSFANNDTMSMTQLKLACAELLLPWVRELDMPNSPYYSFMENFRD